MSISRSPWLFLLLGLLLSATAGVRATIKVEVLEAWPPGDAVVLSTQDSYFLHMAYETDQPVGFWVSAWYRGQQVKRVGSSPSTRYLGTGETMVWLFPLEPGIDIDELRIQAGNGRDNPVQAVWPVRISSRAGEKSSRPPPAWIAEMEARQREVAAMGHGQGENAGGSLLGSLMSMVFVVLALALGGLGLLAPFWAIRRWRDGWRLAAWLPVVGLGLVLLNIVVGVMLDPTSHNLFPFEILIAGMVSGGWMLALFILRWITGRNAVRRA